VTIDLQLMFIVCDRQSVTHSALYVAL